MERRIWQRDLNRSATSRSTIQKFSLRSWVAAWRRTSYHADLWRQGDLSETAVLLSLLKSAAAVLSTDTTAVRFPDDPRTLI